MTAENIYIITKEYECVRNTFNELLIILDKIFDKELNEKEYSLLLNDLFLSRYNKCLDKKYRIKLVEMFFNEASDNQLKYI